MISFLALISGIAAVFYVIIPVAFARLQRRYNESVMERLLVPGVFSGIISGISRDTLYVQPANSDPEKDGLEERILLPLGKTQFFQLSPDGALTRLSWREITVAERSGTVMVYLPDARNRKAFCVFHQERNGSAYQSRLRKAIPEQETAVKLFSIAAGALLEFMIFLHALHSPHMTTVALFALIAIFGKALPYCPPGLLLTHFGHRITVQAAEDKKKCRQRGTVGILVYSAGILLNIALLFLIISRTGL